VTCLDDAVLLDVAEGRAAMTRETQAHLGSCAECRIVFAAAARGAGGTLGGGEAPDEGEPSWAELGAGVVVGGRYVLERFLGGGAMGVVWAVRRTDGAPFAMKTARGTDVELSRRLVREARVLAALDHPSILRPIEVLQPTEKRGACMVLPLLEGETFDAELARQGPLPLSRAACVVRPVAEALASAHALGIVHRDVKPQNVFIARTGVFVLDFGIAKLGPEWGPHSRLTRTGASIGTPRYMAPEQLYGEADVDAAADVWALGALLFYALAGRGPITGATLGDAIRALSLGALDDLGALVPTIPAPVMDVVRRALVVPRHARTATAASFAEVLAAHAGARANNPVW
jgi:serine/threonine-protein kinase